MFELTAPEIIHAGISLSGSKSISNRLLIIKEVLGLGCELINCSDAEDTALLQKVLLQIKNKSSATLNIQHAGTDMRFLTALLSCKKGEWILTGSERMKQRPIGELVNALKQLGADILYLEDEGFPPLKISGKELSGGSVEIDGSISSQFISALLLIAPTFKNGLELTIKNKIVSLPYINMTVELLKQFGADVKIQDSKITVQNLKFKIQNLNFKIESDWSSASYWYSICALSKNAVIELKSLQENSLQADSILPKLFFDLGVNTEFKNDKLILTKKQIKINEFNYDFINCPDIAQTLAVTCYALGIKANLTGLKTLKVKETDRILALKTELKKFGALVDVTQNSICINHAERSRSASIVNHQSLIINTYHDHRMAMAFAPLALKFSLIKIENPEVVTKSYPNFWSDLKKAGFLIQ